MKNYDKYNLEDFLLDEDFRLWVTQHDQNASDFWTKIEGQYPEKKVVMQQARELLLTWNRNQSELSDDDLEIQVSRILASTGPRVTQPFQYRFTTTWISVAASALLIMGIGWGISHKMQKEQPASDYKQYVSQVQVPMKEVVNHTNQKMSVKLPDGSVVALSPASRISYAEAFRHNRKREVYLSGEAFFEVEKDALNPFFVYAHGLVTRVVGTSFLVKTTDTNVEVLVRSGRVSVLAMKDIDNQRSRNTELLLTPNQQAIFSTRDNLLSKSISSMPLELIKPETQSGFVFMDQPIHKVFATLEKVYGIPIVYDSAVMEKCSLHVELSNEPFFTKLDIISQTIGASYRVSDGQVIVSSEGCD
ncbi:FecR family protein [Dyadobacter chenwenxiniae]|uniref:FecR family protein n=1 Tax=Dyadobacter chenwenxiniae TaxID=2906456 RepID=A0A9X1PM15_9BACT|nr:FecR family protein [Dyadobacter chenwenxiniae]MCF0062885.1 FecR family protein [Dyadobacter chenwenxiniae]UON84940.1 FecR family protein [Dyadobacter chenwenxiniae]